MKLAYVGLPCQIEGLRKAQAVSGEIKQDWMGKVRLQIGLFCRENWSYTCFRALVSDDHGIPLENVRKFDIKKKNIIAHLDNGDSVEFPLEKSKPYVRIGCMACLDFTAELADLSIGAVGSPKKWSTVIARTKLGAELLDGAERAGYIEAKDIAQVEPGVKLIKKLAREKLDEALADIKDRETIGVKVPHLQSQQGGLERLKRREERKAFADLNYEIIDTGLCSACGVCEAVCPIGAIKVIEERPQLVKACERNGMCYYTCPRNHLPIKALKAQILDGQKSEEGIGGYLIIKAVRARDAAVLEKGQDGGAVTAILSYALEKKMIDGVVSVMGGKEPWRPEPAISTTKDELHRRSGTFYSYATTIPIIKR